MNKTKQTNKQTRPPWVVYGRDVLQVMINYLSILGTCMHICTVVRVCIHTHSAVHIQLTPEMNSISLADYCLPMSTNPMEADELSIPEIR